MFESPGINRVVQEVEERSCVPKRKNVNSIAAAVEMYLQFDLEESIACLNGVSACRRVKKHKTRCKRPVDVADISQKGDAPMNTHLENDADIARDTINARERRVCTSN
jgi:hypothetical protein